MQKVARNKKKLLEIREVAKKLPSNLWKALAPSLGEEGREENCYRGCRDLDSTRIIEWLNNRIKQAAL